MIAVDTNVLIRLITEDDPKQIAPVKRLFESDQVWIAKTVLLETAWVLKSLRGLEEHAVREAFLRLLGLANVHMESETEVANALKLAAEGIDIADALHYYSRPPAAGFATFDQKFVKRAKRSGAVDVKAL